jgi:serine-type D-Ala-D-Ala endopeptidase (penicillin-binding protein 7)
LMALIHRKLATRALTGILLFSVALSAVARHSADPGRSSADPKLRSGSVLILDQDHATVLYSRNSDVAAPIASITKLMTALVVLDAKQPLGESLQLTADDRDLPKTSFSRLAVGTVLTRGDLMHLALMASENRAAHALGANYPGGMTAMVAAMNAKATALGMTSSHFVDPTGLSSLNVASPEDLARLVMAASKNPTIREFSTDPSYTVLVHRHLVEFHNTDNLVKNPDWKIIVQKTGFINEAGQCLVMQTKIAGRKLIMVFLDSAGKLSRIGDAERVRRWVEANHSMSATHIAG